MLLLHESLSVRGLLLVIVCISSEGLSTVKPQTSTISVVATVKTTTTPVIKLTIEKPTTTTTTRKAVPPPPPPPPPTSSSLSGYSESTTKPDYYGVTNVTTQIGTNAYLPCKVKKVFNKSVSWVRVRDDHILTVDRVAFIADERFTAFYTEPTDEHMPGRWKLQIKYVQPRDAGLYECQVSSEPKISARVYLHIVVPRTELIGDSNRYVKAGSKVSLHCLVSGAIEPPLYIMWYHEGVQIFADNKRGWRADIHRHIVEEDESHSTVGTLTILSVAKRDSGSYKCSPANSTPVNMSLHVINGDYSASAITSSGNGTNPPHLLYLLAVTFAGLVTATITMMMNKITMITTFGT